MTERYCKNCKKRTRHYKRNDWQDGKSGSIGTFARVFFGIFTIGGAELMIDKWLECEECGVIPSGEH